MYGKLYSACLYGIDGVLIEVETDLSNGLPMVSIIGLPDTAVREAVERVRSAIKNCGYTFPLQRITINLAPADLRKEGSAFDLAIALGLLTASGQISLPLDEKVLIIGELALDGALRPVTGVLPMVDLARRCGFHSVLLPVENADEALLLEGVHIYGISHLNQLSFLKQAPDGRKQANPGMFVSSESTVSTDQNASCRLEGASASWSRLEYTRNSSTTPVAQIQQQPDNYSDVSGQRQVKRALTIAAAGMHNLVLIGPPGTGKTMLIRRLPGILPDLSEEEALEVTKIYSSAGKFKEFSHGLLKRRAFRSPHHTISAGGLVGGGPIPKPGEVSLAHKGVLFLDELPEFSRHVLEVLRQPLEERMVTISRSRAAFTFPAHFLLAASMNPCHCGYLGSQPPLPRCTCSPGRISQYRARISGPLLDRIDLQLEVPRPKTWNPDEVPISSEMMREQVLFAQERQSRRLQGSGLSWNSELSGAMLRQSVKLRRDAELLMTSSFDHLGLSMRAYDRIIKLARTIADLEDKEQVMAEHVAEAMQYRQLDKRSVDTEI
ncbi:YifB family Mg chelatase-like AAA ATPase [Paenibacillus caui]|uniref:YifB family Mg chelatase-like AAA ATPase n=1 Tax=Paenibacillus caui TaxID=2873927 RepID=UPI001CA91A63|nr:YifB family Mg chelatase-like AAA ATPase [Paenibacillus caui]